MTDPVRDTRAEAHATVDDCQLVAIPFFRDARGGLGALETGRAVPFPIARVYYITDAVPGTPRGFHAHQRAQRIIWPLSGGLVLGLDDGTRTRTVTLASPDQGLRIPAMIWGTQEVTVAGTVYAVVTDEPYDESEYVRDYDQFLSLRGRRGA